MLSLLLVYPAALLCEVFFFFQKKTPSHNKIPLPTQTPHNLNDVFINPTQKGHVLRKNYPHYIWCGGRGRVLFCAIFCCVGVVHHTRPQNYPTQPSLPPQKGGNTPHLKLFVFAFCVFLFFTGQERSFVFFCLFSRISGEKKKKSRFSGFLSFFFRISRDL